MKLQSNPRVNQGDSQIVLSLYLVHVPACTAMLMHQLLGNQKHNSEIKARWSAHSNFIKKISRKLLFLGHIFPALRPMEGSKVGGVFFYFCNDFSNFSTGNCRGLVEGCTKWSSQAQNPYLALSLTMPGIGRKRAKQGLQAQEPHLVQPSPTPLQLPVISQNLGQYFFNGKCITKNWMRGSQLLSRQEGDDHQLFVHLGPSLLTFEIYFPDTSPEDIILSNLGQMKGQKC